jgi:uncharacterized protein
VVTSTSEPVPVTAGLFHELNPATLLGSRCRTCGTHYFPRTSECRNPTCTDGQLLDVAISRRGRLYSFTVQHYRPPPPFRMEPWAPYTIGVLELPEGLRIMGMLSGVAPMDLRIDMELEVISEQLYQDEQGRIVVTYKFAPPESAS